MSSAAEERVDVLILHLESNQGSVGSRDLYDAVVMTKKMLTHLRQDVKLSCENIIYEIEDISQVLGRTVESTLQSINFVNLSSLRDTLADNSSSKHVLSKVSPSICWHAETNLSLSETCAG